MDQAQVLPLLVVLLVAVFAGWLAVRANRLPSPGWRTTARLIAGIFAVGGLLTIVAVTWFDLRYTRHLPALLSPDGHRRVTVTYTIGDGTGVDEAEVSLRTSGGLVSHRIYAGLAEYRPEDRPHEPEVEWVDNTHLRIRYKVFDNTTGTAEEQGCAAQADGVQIRCEETRVHTVR